MTDEKLTQIVKHAYDTVPFYQNLIKGTNITVPNLDNNNFNNLPLIDKKMVLNSHLRMLTTNCNNYTERKDLLIKRTIDSAGFYRKIYWNKNDDITSNMGLWCRRKQYFGISEFDKYCYFYITKYISNKFIDTPNSIVSSESNALGFCIQNLDTNQILMIYAKMVEFNPAWIMMQPSVALLFANVISKFKLPKIENLKYIELSGEYLTPAVRDKIQSMFQCNVANQYSCIEANSIASECKCGNLHIQSSNVFVEVLRNGKAVPVGEEGEVYITTLENYAMPFVRYKTGERGIIHESKTCRCGSKEPVLELLSGREGALVITEEMEKLPQYIFNRPIEYINERVGNIIRQFQVIQQAINCFTVRLVLNSSYLNWKDTVKEIFIKELNENALKNAQWKFEYMDKLLLNDEDGNLSYFINEYEQRLNN